MKILTLPLKRKWFNMIRDGVKLEEYRECKDYWIDRFARLCGQYEYFFGPKGREMRMAGNLKCDKLVLTIAYPPADDTSRRLEFNNPKISIGEGRPEWGAEPGKQYFVITWDA